MKTNNETITRQSSLNAAQICLASCRKLIAAFEKTKSAIVSEFRETLAGHQQLVRLALNEAEALAWQTEFPHLVFPTLATEKLQALATWDARQRSIQHNHPGRDFAA
jgi:hypothetical protein